MKRLIAYTAMLALLLGCKENPTDVEDTFDKEAMLTNMAENVIVPAYRQFDEDAKTLRDASVAFTEDSSEENFGVLTGAFIRSYRSWNACAVFEFGPAADKNLRLTMNTFPTDTGQIMENLRAESYDLKSAQNADAIGFPALDFLLNTMAAEDKVVMDDPKAAAYIQANAELIATLSSEIISEWGSYQSEFQSNTSSSAGSSLSNLVNEINYEFELVKNARIGIPLGKKTLGETQVEKLEGYYFNISSSLATSNLSGIRNAFTGGDGQGLDDYLNDLDVKKDGVLLSTAIVELMDEIEQELQGKDLAHKITNDPSSLESLYNKTQQLVVLLKTDMPSQLGVQITYQDNDGD
ncbi:MAG: imelysin family protein [Salibacteraceae bacterium]